MHFSGGFYGFLLILTFISVANLGFSDAGGVGAGHDIRPCLVHQHI